MHSIVHLLLAACGLSFLVFIHELGHYFVARRQGMVVEVFSIGFGKPLVSWAHQGVRWQICYLPFGGYVRIAGMEKKGSLEPYQVPNGFYAKRPWQRIQVALAGPFVNMVFAFLAFCALWMMGGREKPFADYTHLVGWVDHHSPLYTAGIRPGDRFDTINDRPFRGFKDLLYSSVLDPSGLHLNGMEIDYWHHSQRSLQYTFEMDENAKGMERGTTAMGLVGPANYVLLAGSLLPEGSPIQETEMQLGDRLLWADGELIFSKKQLSSVINESQALLTVRRGDTTFLSKIPRRKISDLRLTSSQRGDLDDWQHASHVKGKLSQCHFIPYAISPQGIVELPLTYLNDKSETQIFLPSPRATIQIPLEVGDQILAIDGARVVGASEIFRQLQTKHVQLVVKKESPHPLSWEVADRCFVEDFEIDHLSLLVQSIGTPTPLTERGALRLLQPVEPKPLDQFPLPEEIRAQLSGEFLSQKKAIEQISDPSQRNEALRTLEENQKKLILGAIFQDHPIRYNPTPFAQFVGVFDEVWKTLRALVTGYLSPKWLSGPVGIVQVMQYNWMVGFKEALFWMGMISLNLGMVNLLPIPVLDGGHVAFSLWELITKKPIRASTMERLVFPFIVLVIAFFIYITYHDILRLMGL